MVAEISVKPCELLYIPRERSETMSRTREFRWQNRRIMLASLPSYRLDFLSLLYDETICRCPSFEANLPRSNGWRSCRLAPSTQLGDR